MISIYDLVEMWNGFFFSEIPAINVGAFRVLMGLLYFTTCCFLIRDWEALYSSRGVFHRDFWAATNSYKSFSLFRFLPGSDSFVKLVLYMFLLSSFCMMIGFFAELSVCVSFFLWISLVHRNIYIFHSGDALMRLMGFLLMFASSGNSLSVDNILGGESFYLNSMVAWPQRLMMIQLSLVYLKSVYNKMLYGSGFWAYGLGVYYAVRNRVMVRYEMPGFLKNGVGVLMCSWITIVSQPVIGLGLWFRETKDYSIACALLLHGFFNLFLSLGLFSHVMISCLVLFVDPELLQRMCETLGGLIGKFS